jgi:glyoxylase-like metal-dependent hydrolase (beta-lactamase superfamily II)
MWSRGWSARLWSSSGLRLIDVRHLGRERVIGCWQVGEVLIDPGPESSLANLLDQLGDGRPAALLLTHIHLDHAGGSGALVRQWPELEVYVHERGARHLIEPAKLLASAERLYGDQMQRLWGEVVPVPEANVHPLSGGEQLFGFEVAYTPGHASHHVCYYHRASRRAFVGDVAAIHIAPADFVLPPTPPPDVDIEAWERSIATVESWRPTSLGLTHFGAIEEPGPHFAIVRRRLHELADRARRLDADSFERALRAEIDGAADGETAAALVQAVFPELQWPGLDRYWRKRAERS